MPHGADLCRRRSGIRFVHGMDVDHVGGGGVFILSVHTNTKARLETSMYTTIRLIGREATPLTTLQPSLDKQSAAWFLEPGL